MVMGSMLRIAPAGLCCDILMFSGARERLCTEGGKGAPSFRKRRENLGGVVGTINLLNTLRECTPLIKRGVTIINNEKGEEKVKRVPLSSLYPG